MASGASANVGILHGIPHTDGMEGTNLPILADADDADDNDIKEVDMPGMSLRK